ncbi:hypothetical protein B296_00058846 [Ensete ventricosum]|uniref:Uncharacterized protein n=1 Tax=Ensete ventricosum TaxID=4639 RepID=A0A426XK08_ENSVE|nr:hypothetical protein B296_00058846 [Ensete ventricosum]
MLDDIVKLLLRLHIAALAATNLARHLNSRGQVVPTDPRRRESHRNRELPLSRCLQRSDSIPPTCRPRIALGFLYKPATTGTSLIRRSLCFGKEGVGFGNSRRGRCRAARCSSPGKPAARARWVAVVWIQSAQDAAGSARDMASEKMQSAKENQQHAAGFLQEVNDDLIPDTGVQVKQMAQDAAAAVKNAVGMGNADAGSGCATTTSANTNQAPQDLLL